jgi:hypothetical protein
MAILLAVAGVVLAYFLRVTLAGLVMFVGLLAFTRYVANLDRMVVVKKTSMRVIQAATIIVGIAVEIAVLYPFWCQEQAAALEGDLLGAGPDLLPNGATPFLQVGDSKSMMIMLPQKEVQPYFKPYPDAELLFESGSKGPLVSTTVRDRFGNLVVEIKQNHWRIYPPYCSDKNYTKYALEVKDSSGHVLLQLKLVGGPPRVQVQGEWWSNEGKGLRVVKAKDGLRGLVIPLVPENQHNDDLIQEIFRYPSKDHWREFVQ